MLGKINKKVSTVFQITKSLHWMSTVLRIRNPMLFGPLDPGWKKSGSEKKHSVLYFLQLNNNFLIGKFFGADPDPMPFGT
jgi:hypothetical protein